MSFLETWRGALRGLRLDFDHGYILIECANTDGEEAHYLTLISKSVVEPALWALEKDESLYVGFQEISDYVDEKNYDGSAAVWSKRLDGNQSRYFAAISYVCKSSRRKLLQLG